MKFEFTRKQGFEQLKAIVASATLADSEKATLTDFLDNEILQAERKTTRRTAYAETAKAKAKAEQNRLLETLKDWEDEVEFSTKQAQETLAKAGCEISIQKVVSILKNDSVERIVDGKNIKFRFKDIGEND
jgi:ribosomal protein L4